NERAGGGTMPARPGRRGPTMTLLYRDELFLRHDTGRHVEVPARLEAITARLEEAGLTGRCRPGAYTQLTAGQVAEVHAPELVVDWDVHHGNGTQDVWYADPRVTFFSIHRFGWGFYPGTGDSDETGAGPGLGHTFNAPIPYGTSRAQYHAAFRRTLERAAEK